jgi:hypothetical protein
VVRVRYPLAIRSFEVALEPPAYTGTKPGTIKGGDIHAIAGTAATFRIAFDATPAEASLVLTDPSARDKGRKCQRLGSSGCTTAARPSRRS